MHLISGADPPCAGALRAVVRESAQFLAASRRRADNLACLRRSVLGQAHPVGHLNEPTRAHNSAPLAALSTNTVLNASCTETNRLFPGTYLIVPRLELLYLRRVLLEIALREEDLAAPTAGEFAAWRARLGFFSCGSGVLSLGCRGWDLDHLCLCLHVMF